MKRMIWVFPVFCLGIGCSDDDNKSAIDAKVSLVDVNKVVDKSTVDQSTKNEFNRDRSIADKGIPTVDAATGNATIGKSGGKLVSKDQNLTLDIPASSLSADVAFGITSETVLPGALTTFTAETGATTDTTKKTLTLSIMHLSCYVIVEELDAGKKVHRSYSITPDGQTFSPELPAKLVFNLAGLTGSGFKIYSKKGACPAAG